MSRFNWNKIFLGSLFLWAFNLQSREILWELFPNTLKTKDALQGSEGDSLEQAFALKPDEDGVEEVFENTYAFFQREASRPDFIKTHSNFSLSLLFYDWLHWLTKKHPRLYAENPKDLLEILKRIREQQQSDTERLYADESMLYFFSRIPWNQQDENFAESSFLLLLEALRVNQWKGFEFRENAKKLLRQAHVILQSQDSEALAAYRLSLRTPSYFEKYSRNQARDIYVRAHWVPDFIKLLQNHLRSLRQENHEKRSSSHFAVRAFLLSLEEFVSKEGIDLFWSEMARRLDLSDAALRVWRGFVELGIYPDLKIFTVSEIFRDFSEAFILQVERFDHPNATKLRFNPWRLTQRGRVKDLNILLGYIGQNPIRREARERFNQLLPTFRASELSEEPLALVDADIERYFRFHTDSKTDHSGLLWALSAYDLNEDPFWSSLVKRAVIHSELWSVSESYKLLHESLFIYEVEIKIENSNQGIPEHVFSFEVILKPGAHNFMRNLNRVLKALENADAGYFSEIIAEQNAKSCDSALTEDSGPQKYW